MGNNKKAIIISSSIVAVLAATAAGFYWFSGNSNVPAALLTSNSSPYSLEYGVTLVNSGATSPVEAEELNEEQYNNFIDDGLSDSKQSLEIFKLSNDKTISEFVEGVSSSLGLKIVQEQTIDGQAKTGLVQLANNKGEEFILSIVEEEYSNMNWEYSNSTALSRNSKCPSLAEPSIYDFMIKTPEEIFESTPEGEEIILFPDYTSMNETELNETFYMEAYNITLSSYEEECAKTVKPDSKVLEDLSKKFLNNFGLTELEVIIAEGESLGMIQANVYQNIDNKNGPKVATIFFDHGSNVVKAQGIYYTITSLGELELLSPKESIIRTKQKSRILGEINANYTEGYSIVNTTSPKNDKKEYSLNSHENIYLTLATIDGYLFVPGYLLYDNSTKETIYVVAVPDEAFQNQ